MALHDHGDFLHAGIVQILDQGVLHVLHGHELPGVGVGQEQGGLAAFAEAAAPLVRAIASYRGMALADMVQRIQANAAIWKVLAGGITGQRLAYFDRVAAAATVEEVQAIIISYSIPAEVESLQIFYQSLQG